MEKLTALQKVTLCTVTVATHTHTIIFLLAIKQWGTHSSRARPATISFPISFTSACYSVVAQDGFSSKVLNDYSSLYEKPSTSSFKFTYDTETSFVCWIAIGK